MDSQTSVDEIYDFFKEIESEYELLKYKIDNIYFWKLLRFLVWEEINYKAGLMGKSHPLRKENIVKKVINTAKKDFNIYRYNALRIRVKNHVLVFQSPRKVYIEGQLTDYYTYYIRKSFQNHGEDKSVNLELETFGYSYCERFQSKIALPSVLKRKFCSYFSNFKFTKNDLSLLDEITNIIRNRFNVEVNLKGMSENQIICFKYNYRYYQRLFEKLKPKKVIMVCSYGNEALISAAQDLGVEVYEIQHGTISKYHLGYSFPEGEKVPYFPDYIMTYGDYWVDTTPIPLVNKNILNIGFPYLMKNLAQYNKVSKTKNSVIFLSQGTIGKKLSEIAFEFAQRNSLYKVVYKLHPSEYNDWRKLYPQLNEAEKLKNFKIVDERNINLYQLLAESEYQVGVYSTALYEGLVLDLKTIVIKLPGVEEMGGLIEKGIVMIANSIDELENNINSFNSVPYSKEYFFSESIETDEIVKEYFI